MCTSDPYVSAHNVTCSYTSLFINNTLWKVVQISMYSQFSSILRIQWPSPQNNNNRQLLTGQFASKATRSQSNHELVNSRTRRFAD